VELATAGPARRSGAGADAGVRAGADHARPAAGVSASSSSNLSAVFDKAADMGIEGASRMSSVSGLKVNPQIAMRLPRTEPPQVRRPG
jgi:hypothetical protein